MDQTRLVPLTPNAVRLVRECRDWILKQGEVEATVRRLTLGSAVTWYGLPADRVMEWTNVLTFIVSEFEAKGGPNGGA